MRIEGPKNVTETNAKKPAARVSGGSSFGSFLDTDAAEVAQTRGASLVADVGGLLAVQEADDTLERQSRRRMVKRGEALLKELDMLRGDLLAGAVSLRRLQSLDALLTQAREQINDPRLTAILDEIELRAAVERAKLEMAAEQG